MDAAHNKQERCKMTGRTGQTNGLAVYAYAYVAFLYLPIVFLILFSFNESIYAIFPIRSFTFDWYIELVSNVAILIALKNSFLVAITSSLISTCIAVLAANALVFHDLKTKTLLIVVLSAPIAVPAMILGLALLIWLSVLGLNLSLLTVGMGHVLLCTPFALLIMLSRLEGFNRSLIEASNDLGESEFATFIRIKLPLFLPGIFSSVLMTFTLSFDEFVITYFLSGNETTLPLYIWSQLRFPSQLPNVLALGSCIIFGSFVLIVLSALVRSSGPNK